MKPARDRIEEALNTLAKDWPALEDEINASGAGATSGAVQLPGGTVRTSLAIEVPVLLRLWCAWTVAGRELPGTSVPVGDVPGMCAWLDPHAPWLAEVVDNDGVTLLTSRATEVRQLVEPSGVRVIDIGACPAVDCDGRVQATLTGDAFKDGGQDLVCDVDPEHAWPPSRYGILAAAMGQVEQQRMSAVELAEYLSARFKVGVTQQHVAGWTRRYPIELRREADGTYDRVRATDWYIGWRAQRATVSA